MAALTGTITQAGRWQSGMEYTALGAYTLVGAITNADTITFTNLLPANDTQIIAFEVFGQELDTNASPTLALTAGDGTTANGYLTSKTAGDATGQMHLIGDGAFIGASNQASRNVVLTTSGTLGTAASSGTVYVRVRYYCSGE